MALTTHSIVHAIKKTASECQRVIACGGGVNNPVLMTQLAAALGTVTLQTTADFGLPPDFIEAAAFAWLAQRTLSGLSGNIPQVTGASHPCVLGGIYPAHSI